MKPKKNIVLQNDFNKNREIESIFYRLIFVGDPEVGKTQIINKYNQKRFMDKYEPTFCADFQIRPIIINNKRITIYCIDTEGGSDISKFTGKSLIRKADGFIFVYDITIINSLNNLSILYKNFESEINPMLNESKKIIYFVGNKCDLRTKRQVFEQTGREMADKYEAKFMEVSAKNGLNIDKLFDNIIKDIMKRDENSSSKENSVFTRSNIFRNTNTLRSNNSSGNINRNGTFNENESALNYETSSYFLKSKNSFANNNDYINNLNKENKNENFKNSIYSDINKDSKKCLIF